MECARVVLIHVRSDIKTHEKHWVVTMMTQGSKKTTNYLLIKAANMDSTCSPSHPNGKVSTRLQSERMLILGFTNSHPHSWISRIWTATSNRIETTILSPFLRTNALAKMIQAIQNFLCKVDAVSGSEDVAPRPSARWGDHQVVFCERPGEF